MSQKTLHYPLLCLTLWAWVRTGTSGSDYYRRGSCVGYLGDRERLPECPSESIWFSRGPKAGSYARIAQACGVTARTVRTWCHRFLESGIEGLWDASRSGRPKTITEADADRVAELVQVSPSDGKRWTVRSVAREIGLSSSAVGRIWHALGIHRSNCGSSAFVVAEVGGVAGTEGAESQRQAAPV